MVVHTLACTTDVHNCNQGWGNIGARWWGNIGARWRVGQYWSRVEDGAILEQGGGWDNTGAGCGGWGNIGTG